MSINRLELAQIVARFVHCGQKHGERSYYEHLRDVHSVLARFGHNDEDLHVAAYLHDSIEDKHIKAGLIEDYFGTKVAKMVERVSKETGMTRRESNLKTLPKIAQCPEATLLKLADRIANVECDGTKKDMYREEQDHFKGVLHVRGQYTNMWKHLDKLLAP